MAENDTYTSIERTYCIDAGKDFIILQYLNFFLCILEERLQESLLDTAPIESVMKPFNEGYMLLVEYLKLNIFSRRHADKIVDMFNDGYMKAMDPELLWEREEYAAYVEDAHIIISKICHLVHYEQRYTCLTHNRYSMLAPFSLHDLIDATRLSNKEMTCKSKERREFTYGRIYLKGCRRIIRDINVALVNFGYKELPSPFQILLCRTMDLYDIVERLKNMVSYIEVSKKIPRPYIRREIESVHQSFHAFEAAFLNAFSQQATKNDVPAGTNNQSHQGGPKFLNSQPHKEKVARVLKSLAVNLASLRWGLYFLTLSYGSGYINQFGELAIKKGNVKNRAAGRRQKRIVQTSCTIS